MLDAINIFFPRHRLRANNRAANDVQVRPTRYRISMSLEPQALEEVAHARQCLLVLGRRDVLVALLQLLLDVLQWKMQQARMLVQDTPLLSSTHERQRDP